MCFLLTAHQHPGGTGPSVLTAVPELRLPALAPQGCARGVHPACSALGRTGFWDEQGQVPAQPTGSREHSPPHGSLTPGVSDSHEPTTNLTPGQDVIKEVCPQRLTSSHIRGGRMPNTVLPESRRHIHAGSAAATPVSLAPHRAAGVVSALSQVSWTGPTPPRRQVSSLPAARWLPPQGVPYSAPGLRKLSAVVFKGLLRSTRHVLAGTCGELSGS